MMIIYEVTTDVQPDHIEAYERYMRERHIPDVMATGCFVSATLTHSIPGRYRVAYLARNMDVLDEYLGAHSEQFRDDFAAELGSNVRVSREVWAEMHRWTAGGDASP
ncbi:MAG: DUF4286 family protein [Gemmatimonadaceae bacterium]|nr:DUF4286 family protein [Gemmatimonadaceae bacterium]